MSTKEVVDAFKKMDLLEDVKDVSNRKKTKTKKLSDLAQLGVLDGVKKYKNKTVFISGEFEEEYDVYLNTIILRQLNGYRGLANSYR